MTASVSKSSEDLGTFQTVLEVDPAASIPASSIPAASIPTELQPISTANISVADETAHAVPSSNEPTKPTDPAQNSIPNAALPLADLDSVPRAAAAPPPPPGPHAPARPFHRSAAPLRCVLGSRRLRIVSPSSVVEASQRAFAVPAPAPKPCPPPGAATAGDPAVRNLCRELDLVLAPAAESPSQGPSTSLVTPSPMSVATPMAPHKPPAAPPSGLAKF